MSVPDWATRAVAALAVVTATEPVSDWAFTLALVLVTVVATRLPEDLSRTPEVPETAPVVKVPVVDCKSTAPVLLVTAPVEALPTALKVMLPDAVPEVAVNVPADVKVAVPPLTA